MGPLIFIAITYATTGSFVASFMLTIIGMICLGDD